jgi:hypothetical protein
MTSHSEASNNGETLYCVWYRDEQNGGFWNKSLNCDGVLTLEQAKAKVTKHRLTFGPRKYAIFPVGFQPTANEHYDYAEIYGGVNSEKLPYKPCADEIKAIAQSLVARDSRENVTVGMVVPAGACQINIPKGYDGVKLQQFLDALATRK